MSSPNDFESPAHQSSDMRDYKLSDSFPVGNLTVHHLSDGLASGARQNWFNGIEPSTWMPVLGLKDENTPFPLNYGLFAIVGHGRTTLVDSGFGPEVQQFDGVRGGGELLQRLSEIGVRPEDVDNIVQTHLHADHCGQLVTDTDNGGRVTFENAAVHVHERELEFWTGPETDANFMAPYVRSRIAPIAAAGLISTFTGTVPIAPGVLTIPMPGHSPGHTCVLVSDGGHSCLLVGDLAHHPVHFSHHDWLHAFDAEPSASQAARRSLCELAASLDAVVTAPHMPILTLGRIRRDSSRWGYSWTSVDPAELGSTDDSARAAR